MNKMTPTTPMEVMPKQTCLICKCKFEPSESIEGKLIKLMCPKCFKKYANKTV